MTQKRRKRLYSQKIMKKRILTLLITMIFFTLCLTGCGNNSTTTEAVQNKKPGDYILTTTTGIITMFDESDNIVTSITLNGTQNSNFIYRMDEGNLYSSQLTNVNIMPQMFYALDLSSRKLTLLTIHNNQINKKAEYILSESNILDFHAYNGIVYYSTKSNNIAANSYSFERRQKLNNNGKLNYLQNITLNTSNQSTYIYMENYFEEYLVYTGLDKFLSSTDKALINTPKLKHAIYEIPTDVKTWVANSNKIYFFTETQMGIYNTLTNKISVHYGTINPIKTQYIDGINKRIFLMSDFGEGSEKSVLMSLKYDDLTVDTSTQIDYSNPITINVEKNNYILAIFKVTNSSKTFSQLRVLNYSDKSELYVIGVDYLPTKVLTRGESLYLFNPYEPNFLIGTINSSDFSKVNKTVENSTEFYSDIFLVNVEYKNDYFYDENGRFVNRHDHLINADGELIDNRNDLVNKIGQRIDALGRAIDKDGNLIDKYGNIIDIDGNIVQYVKTADGYYYNADGKKCDADGTVLVRNEIGDWVRPEIALEEQGGITITGHYDEHGNFIIDQDILDEYPDAYELWQEQQN